MTWTGEGSENHNWDIQRPSYGKFIKESSQLTNGESACYDLYNDYGILKIMRFVNFIVLGNEIEQVLVLGDGTLPACAKSSFWESKFDGRQMFHSPFKILLSSNT